MPPKDDLIALFGAILLIAGIAIQFGLGWSMIMAGVICVYGGMRMETAPATEPENDDIIIQ